MSEKEKKDSLFEGWKWVFIRESTRRQLEKLVMRIDFLDLPTPALIYILVIFTYFLCLCSSWGSYDQEPTESEPKPEEPKSKKIEVDSKDNEMIVVWLYSAIAIGYFTLVQLMDF